MSRSVASSLFCSALPQLPRSRLCSLEAPSVFVGLIVPHLVRLLGLADHRWLLPGSVLVGGGFLTLADTVARSAWAPLQFPVGVLTALLGVPILLLLLAGKNKDAAH